jgi:hypothetical protein
MAHATRTKEMIRFGLGVAAVLVLGYVLLLAFLYARQRTLLFPASRVSASTAEAGLPDFRDVVLQTSDGERLVAWWKPPEPGRALLLYFHGNGGSLLNRRHRVRALSADGRGVLIVSYRGYSGSTGDPSEAGIRLDAVAARDWLASYEPARIVLYGESLGTGVAIWLATERRVAGVILDAPYTSTADVAQALFRYVPVALLMRDQFRSIDRVDKVAAPLLMMHGDRDGVIPIAQSRTLFAAANEPKRYLELPGTGHEEVLERGGLAAVRSFLDEVEARLKR